jgi:hypothetical protein
MPDAPEGRQEVIMNAALTVILAVIALGLVYVVAPVALSAFRRLRAPRLVQCPATGAEAEIVLDAVRGAVTAATGRPVVRVEACTNWPQHEHCGQECVAQVDAPVREEHAA